MKKLLLILALALSANAWGEFKTIDCFGVYQEGPKKGQIGSWAKRITFDPELPDAEMEEFKDGECWRDCKTLPVKVTVFPNYYRFVWEDTILLENYDVSRKDLTFAGKSKSRDYRGVVYHVSPRIGKCELVEIDTSENIL